MEEKKPKKKKALRRELLEWGIMLGIAGTLYLTGLHTEVIGNLQRVLLWTGLMTPDIEMDPGEIKAARYNMPMISLDGQSYSLADFKDKTIFLNFWATWCPPCIAEMPNIQALYEDVVSDSIAFVMVSLDEDPEKARAYMARKEYTMPVYFLTGPKPGVFNSTVVPTTYVISPEGQIVSERRGMANYNTDEFRTFLRGL